MQLDRGTLIGERYVIEGLLGRGGMAVVYAARDRRLGIEVALKVLGAHGESIRERLIREGQVQAALRHPNVLTVSDIVEIRGLPGIIMELVPGPDLDRLLQEDCLDAVEREHLARGIIAGLAAAHAHGVVHRDLKPHNVLIHPVEGALVPKIADFGLVKVLGETGGATRTGAAMGTPRYMAPEQFMGASEVGPAADLFSLGATLYELFSGRPAFQASSLMAMHRAISAGDYPPLTGPPDRICAAVQACLSPEIQDRPASAQAVLELFDRGSDLPAARFRPETLARVRALTPRPVVQTEELSPTATMPEPASRGAPTWSADAQQASQLPPRRSVLWAAGLGAVGLLGALGLGAWMLSAPAHEPFTLAGPPPITDGPAIRRLLEQAWQEGRANESVDAFAHLNEAVESGARDPAVHLLLANAYLSFQDWDGFSAALDRGIALAPDDPDDPVASLMHTLHRKVRSETDLRWWAPTLDAHRARFPEDQLARDLMASGMYFDQEDIPYRPEIYDWYTDNEPDQVGSWVGVLEGRRVHGDLAGAERAMREGLERFPRSAAMWAGSSFIALDRGRPRQALDDSNRCLRLDRGWHPCLAGLVRAQVWLDDDDGLHSTLAPVLDDTAAPGAQLMVIWGTDSLGTFGRRYEAERFLDTMAGRMLEREMDRTLVQHLIQRARLAVLPGMASPEQLAATIGAAADELAAPNLAAVERARQGRAVLALQTLQALRDGDSALAERRGARNRPTREDASILAVEQAFFAGDIARLQASTGCRARVVAALHLVALAAPKQALALLDTTVDEELPCIPPVQAELVALSHAARALAHHDLGLADEAGLHVANMASGWPSPDPDLPIVTELAREVSPAVLGAAPLQTFMRRRGLPEVRLRSTHPCLDVIPGVVQHEAGLEVPLPPGEACQAVEAAVVLALAPAPAWR